MTAAENKALLLREYAECYEARNPAHFADFCVPDWKYYGPSGVTQTKEQLIANLTAIFIAFPDSRYVLEGVMADEDTVVARWSWSGTHRAAWRGMAPTGKLATTSGIAIYRIVDGKYVETWEQYDALGLLQQLGAVTVSAPAPA